jgi:polyisoprenoid-binding protein YceI
MKFIPIGMLGLLLAACTAPPATRAPSAPARPADFPAAFYREAIAAGGAVYRVDPTRSLGTVYAYRGGSLRKLGHDHVIASHEIRGYCLAGTDNQDSRADLYVPLASLAIDEPALRRSAGFPGELRPDEIAATRVHMLDSVLQADRYPFLQLHAAWATERRDKVLNVEIRLHGVARSYRVPVQYSRNSNSLTVSGQLRIRQTDFGMTPYSVLGGALRVKDELRLRFSVTATRLMDSTWSNRAPTETGIMSAVSTISATLGPNARSSALRSAPKSARAVSPGKAALDLRPPPPLPSLDRHPSPRQQCCQRKTPTRIAPTQLCGTPRTMPRRG